tara:strand:- start:35 stop:541 length:507 start_codon:yes stop_codon:yes gene_type:complete
MKLDIKKLKDGDRIQFGKGTFAQCTNYEVDVSGLKGTITEVTVNDDEVIVVRLDKHHDDFKYWDNEIYFDLNEDLQHGTHYSYLEKAKLLGNKKKTLNLDDIVQACELEFWDELIKHMPLAESGDSDPMQSFRFQSAMEEAIKSWWHFNGSEHYNLKDGDEILVRRDD